MAKIYRLSDRIPLDFGDGLIITVAPLSMVQKEEIQGHVLKSELVKAACKAVKYGVKSVKGVTDNEGNPYELSFENGILSDESVNDLFNLSEANKLSATCFELLNGVGNKWPEGVEVVEKK